MNKKKIPVKEFLLISLCFAIGMGIRVFLALTGRMAITDDMQFFLSSVIQEKQSVPVMTSGVAFAYSKSLSDIFRFVGNRMEVIVWYHILLQAFSFVFLYFGCRLLFGKIAAFFTSAVSSVSPWLISGIFAVSPENFYLFCWSFLFLLIGILALKTWEIGWFRKCTYEIFLTLLGFCMGIVCILHCMDMNFWLPLEVILTICIGALLEIAFRTVSKKKTNEQIQKKQAFSVPEDLEMEEKKEEKQIKYLDNPLPLPKKHVKRTFDFEFDKKDDFDIEIDENDDFDI